MPGGDRTGPMGTGPMTGWGRGFCQRAPGNQWFGNFGGWGGGRGGGRGRRNQFYVTGLPGWQRRYPARQVLDRKEESSFLKEQAEYLSGELESIRARLNEMEQNEKK